MGPYHRLATWDGTRALFVCCSLVTCFPPNNSCTRAGLGDHFKRKAKNMFIQQEQLDYGLHLQQDCDVYASNSPLPVKTSCLLLARSSSLLGCLLRDLGFCSGCSSSRSIILDEDKEVVRGLVSWLEGTALKQDAMNCIAMEAFSTLPRYNYNLHIRSYHGYIQPINAGRCRRECSDWPTSFS